MKLDAEYFESYFRQYSAVANDIAAFIDYYKEITNIYDAFSTALSYFFPVERDEYFVANGTLFSVESLLSLTHHVTKELNFIRLDAAIDHRVLPIVERSIGSTTIKEPHGLVASIRYGATEREPSNLLKRVFVDHSLYAELLLPYEEQWVLSIDFDMLETEYWNTLKIIQVPPLVVNISEINVGGVVHIPRDIKYPHLFQLSDTTINSFSIVGFSPEVHVMGGTASIIGFTHIGLYYRRYHTYGVFNGMFTNNVDREVSVTPIYYIPSPLYDEYDAEADIVTVKLYKRTASPSGFELIWTSLAPTNIILDAGLDIYVEVELRGTEHYTPLFYGIKLVEV